MAIMKVLVGNIKGPTGADGKNGKDFKYEDFTAAQLNALVKNIAADVLEIANVSVTSTPIGYVSLGDSIAAGHTINANWEKDYGEKSQYGVNGNTKTQIVSGCYTDIIRNYLVDIYGEKGVSVSSFAHSGDTVSDLINKLSHEAVRSAIAKANLVTICIGANDVLQPAVTRLAEYMSTGSLASAEAAIAANMANLDNDSSATSFVGLFNKLSEINPNAKYVFTTIYNPFKYLHLDEGIDGFYAPLLDTIPDLNIGIPNTSLQINLTDYIRQGIIEKEPFQLSISRVNGLSGWAEQRVNQLNTILRNKISAYRATNPNFSVVEAKAAFDQFPDKTDNTGDVDYCDLVHVEFTSGYTTAKMDWALLWRTAGKSREDYWWDLVTRHLYWIWAFPSINPMDYVDFDWDAYFAEIGPQILNLLILPNVDPHPKYQGHQVLERVFTNGVGLVKYEANGGSHYCGEVLYPSEKLPYTVPARPGYYFGGWYADAKLLRMHDHSRTDYSDSASLTLSELVSGNTVKVKVPKTTTLYAKWPNSK